MIVNTNTKRRADQSPGSGLFREAWKRMPPGTNWPVGGRLEEVLSVPHLVCRGWPGARVCAERGITGATMTGLRPRLSTRAARNRARKTDSCSVVPVCQGLEAGLRWSGIPGVASIAVWAAYGPSSHHAVGRLILGLRVVSNRLTSPGLSYCHDLTDSSGTWWRGGSSAGQE